MLEQCREFVQNIPDNLNYITPDELIAKLNDNPNDYFLIDIRDEESFRKYHIKGAVNIFLKEVLNDKNIEKLPKNKMIVVCCWVGHTASQILTILQLLGYDAIGLKYGMGESAKKGEKQLGWKQLGLPTE